MIGITNASKMFHASIVSCLLKDGWLLFYLNREERLRIRINMPVYTSTVHSHRYTKNLGAKILLQNWVGLIH